MKETIEWYCTNKEWWEKLNPEITGSITKNGFCVLSDTVLFAYKCTDFYNSQAEKGITWNDPDIAIEWPVKNPILSDKDKTYVDKAEEEPGLAMDVNGYAPGILAEEAKRLGSFIVHYSTDYVFDGTNFTAGA